MVRVLDNLKAQARILHRQAAMLDAAAVARLRKLPELRGIDAAGLPAVIRRRHSLAVIARELGFDGWPHAVAVLGGEPVTDFGTLLYPPYGSGHANIWLATYEQARTIRNQNNGYLLAYKRQFVVTDGYFITSLGLDPEDPDWDRIGRDWVRPAEPEARDRLYERLIAHRQAQLAAAQTQA